MTLFALLVGSQLYFFSFYRSFAMSRRPDSPQDNFVETSYMEDVAKLALDPEKGKPVVVPISRDKCGIDDVDIEILVIRRALGRIKKHSQNPAVDVDVEVISHGIDRMMKALRASRITQEEVEAKARLMAMTAAAEDDEEKIAAEVVSNTSFPLSSPMTPSKATSLSAALSPAKLQTSPAFGERQKALAQVKLKQQRANAELDALRQSASQGLWGTLLTILNHAGGDYKLAMNERQVKARSASLLSEAKIFGMAALGTALMTLSSPQVTIRGAAINPSTPKLGDDRVLPRGIVAYLRDRGLPVVAAASSKWGNHTVDSIIDPSLRPFMTTNQQGSNITVDFGGAVVRPTAYGFASVHNILPGYFPKNWRLLGSRDGVQWSVIKEHSNDVSFAGKVPSCWWSIDQSEDDDFVCRSIRVEISGPNSFGTNELQVSSFEVYGSLLLIEHAERPKLVDTALAARPRGFGKMAAVPDVASLMKKGKGKK